MRRPFSFPGTDLEFTLGMEKKTPSGRINSYLVSFPKHLGAILRLCVVMVLSVTAACTGDSTTINQTNPPASQASGNTRTSDPDGWGGGGTGDGGGGQGVYCSNKMVDKKYSGRLMVRDVYEASHNDGRTFKFDSLGPAGSDKVDDAAIAYLMSSLVKYYGLAIHDREFFKKDFWKNFADKISFVPEGTHLYPSKDANSPLALADECRLVQIAYWDEAAGSQAEGTLFVEKSAWIQLDQLNKIALLAHEYFFKLARQGGFTNSDYVRSKVGALLSQEGLSPMLSHWAPSKDPNLKGMLPESSKGFKYCTGKAGNSLVEFYQYQDSNQHQRIVYTNIQTPTYQMPVLSSVDFEFDPSIENSTLPVITDDFVAMNPLYPTKDKLQNKTMLERFNDPSGGELQATIPFPTQKSKIQGSVSVINGFSSYRNLDHRELRPKEELISITNRFIETRLGYVFANTDVTSAQKLNLLSVLLGEIDDGIKAKVFPTGFPKFNTAVKKLAGPVVTNSESYVNDMSRINDGYAVILYRLKIGSYGKQMVWDAIYDNGFLPSSDRFRQGHINITIDQTSIDLSVSCNSYRVFSNSLLKNTAEPKFN